MLSVNPSMLQAWTDVLENMPDAVFIVAGTGKAGRILYLNSQAIRMFGYERSEIVNQSIEMLVPQNVRERHIQHRLGYAQGPHLRHMGAGLSLFGRRRNGTEFPIDVLLNPNDDGAVQANDSLQEILPRLRSEFGYSAARKSLMLDIEASAEFARSDSMLLPVILRNLIGNAIEFVFTRRGQPITRINNSGWKAARRRASKRYAIEIGRSCPKGFRSIRVHDLKHTYSHRLRAVGIGFEDRKLLLGHKADHVTTHYSAPEIEAWRQSLL